MSVRIQAEIHDGPLPPQVPGEDWPDAGAVITFLGIVRPTENGRLLIALDYETYDPMAANMLRERAEKVATQYNLLGVYVEHSRGRVPVGQCSFRLTIASAHRQEGLQAMAGFIDQMKQDVPIWKTAVWA